MRRARWNAFNEALANLVARPALTFAMIAVWAGAVVATFVADSAAVTGVVAYEHDLVDAGYRTLYVESNQNLRTPLTAADCESLGRLGGVEAVVWLMAARPGNLVAPAGPSVPVRFVGGAVVEFLTKVDPDGMRRWTGQQVFVDAMSPIVRHGESRPLAISVGDRSGVFDTHSVALTTLGGGLSGNLVAISAHATGVESCAMLVGDADRNVVRASVDAAMPVGRGYVARWALPSADQFEAPGSRFAERGAQWTWMAGAVVVAIAHAMYLRIRRSDHNFYAMCGLPGRRLMSLMSIEMMLLALIASVAAATSIMILTSKVHDGAALAAGSRASIRCGLVALVIGGGSAALRAVHCRQGLVRELKDL